MKKLSLLLLTILTLWSCKKSDEEFESDPSLYTEYISAFSYGRISKYSPIAVKLSKELSDEVQNKISELEVFDFSPSVEGKTVYTPSGELQFIPSEPLKEDTKYRVTLDLSELYPEIPKDLKTFRFIVQTLEQHYSVRLESLQSYNKDLYYLSGVLQGSEAFNAEEASEIVTAYLNDRPIPITFPNHQGNISESTFVIDSIPATIEGASLRVAWQNGSEGEQISISLPSRNSFIPMSAKVSEEDSNTILVNFSKPLKKDQNFSGLIDVDVSADYYFVVNNNLLKVIFKGALEGDVNLKIHKGIKSAYGDILEEEYNYPLVFSPQKPDLKWVKNGSILPDSKNLKINFQSINLRAVDVTIYRIYQNNVLQFLQEYTLSDQPYKSDLRRVASPIAKKRILLEKVAHQNLNQLNSYAIDLSTIIKPEPGAIYNIVLSYKKDYAITACGDERKPLEPFEQYKDFDSSEDNNDYYDDDYDWRERDNPCHNTYYYDKKIETNVLASNLGVIAKKGQENQYTIVVNNILTTEPEEKALVEVYDYQQQKIGEGTTNSDGIAVITTSKEGYFVLAKKDNSTTYVKINNGMALSVSNFDVDGTELQKGMNGYIYTERGVWRPGDNVYVGFILNDFGNKIPEGLPIQLSFKDPYGKIIQQRTQNSNAENHYTFTLSTPDNAPTGNWLAEIKVGAARFSKRIKIETVKPNRLKILTNTDGKTLSKKDKTIHYDIQWLQGMPAANVLVEAKAKFTRAKTEFKGYKGYVFDNQYSYFDENEVNIASEVRTDEKGKLKVNFNPEIEDAPGMLNVYFLTKANERGGDFSTDVSKSLYSPYDIYSGIKVPAPNKYDFYNTDKNYVFEVATVNEKGKAVSEQYLEVHIFKTDWSWWWDASRNQSNYTASTRRDLYAETSLTTDSNGKASFDFEVPNADWGRYVILVSNPKNGQTSAISAYFDWDDWYTRADNSNSKEAAMLMLRSDKTTYSVNDKARITFPSEGNARALVSIENGSKVLQTRWLSTNDGETVCELPITEEMTPNVYVSVTLLQPHAKTANDHPIRMFGVIPINVENPQTHLSPQIQMADVLRPEQKTTIKVSEKSGKAMTYSLAIVEDGLLDLTRFKTPNAWDVFFKKNALGVQTWDVYNDIMGAYGGKINQVFSIGGDENLAGAKAQKANRFDPLVIFKGPFELGKGKSETHTIELPNYIGSARVMVIASDVEKNAYGSAEKTVPVRSPLMVLGSVPRKASPQEKITLPVTVFATEKAIKNAKVQIEVNGIMQVSGAQQQNVSFSEPSEKMLYFDLNVGNQTGIAKIKITATSGSEKAVYQTDLEVFNPNPRTYTQVSSVLSKGVGESLEWQVFGAKGTNEVTLEVSNFPGVNLAQRVGYLVAYPHGCSEQITSKAFPQLYLDAFAKLTEDKAKATQRNINAALAKLHERQLPSGGFTYWQGGADADDWVTSYIGHFMIEAERQGYALPANSKNQWWQYQQRAARDWKYNRFDNNDISQAYRLYTLALSGKPDKASMNRLREFSGLTQEAQMLLAATYGLSGQKNVGKNLYQQTPDKTHSDDYYGSEVRTKSIGLMATLVLLEAHKSAGLALDIAQELSSSRRMSTQSTAFALVAMAQYVKANPSAPIEVTINRDGKKETIKTNEPMVSRSLSIGGANKIFVQNNTKGTAYVKVVSSGILPIGEELAQQEGLQVNTRFKDRKGNSISVENIRQATEFIAEISVTNQTNSKVDHIALTQLIPSGWEIINMRYTDYSSDSPLASHIDIRDDRANFYFSLNGNQTKTFQLILNASYLGKYYLPGTYAEGMYDLEYNARNKGRWVEVVK